MRELIYREDLLKEIVKSYPHFDQRLSITPVFDAIRKANVIDAEPVRHGRWLDGNRGKHDGTLYWYRYCSECLYERDDDNEDKDTPYCPNCGASMDGESKQVEDPSHPLC